MVNRNVGETRAVDPELRNSQNTYFTLTIREVPKLSQLI